MALVLAGILLSSILLANTAYAATITVGTSPSAVAINPDTNMVYVANAGSSSVSVIDGSPGSATENTVLTTITVGSSPNAIAVNPDTNMVYVANTGSNSVSVIDGSTNTVVSTITVGNAPVGLAVNPDTDRVYVGNLFSGTVSVIDGSPGSATENTVLTTITLPGGAARLAVNPDTDIVYVANFLSNQVFVIDGITDTLVTTITVGNAPAAIATNPDENLIYVANDGSNSVSVIDGSTNTVVDTIAVGIGPVSVAVDPEMQRIYTANFDSNSVSVIDGSANVVVGTIPVGIGPRGLALNIDTQKVYVGNSGSNTVSVIDVLANNLPVADAGPDQTVDEGSLVTLDGTASSDPDGDPLSFLWLQTDGPIVTLSDGTAANPTFTAPLVDSQTLVLTFQLKVNDGSFASSPDSVNIVVKKLNTFPVTLSAQPDGALVANVGIGDVSAGTTITFEFQTPPETLPFAELQKTVIPVGVDGSDIAFSFILSPQVLAGLPAPPIDTALFLSVDFAGIDFSNPSSFQAGQLPTGNFLVDRNFPSEERFSDGCPVIPIVLLNEASGQWEQIGDPLVPDTNKVYVTNQFSNTVSVIDGFTNDVIDTITVGNAPRGIGFDPNTKRVYVNNFGSNTVFVIDGSTNDVIDTITVGSSPSAVGVNPNTNRIYVTNFGSNTVSIIDGSTNDVIDTIAVGITPIGLDINPNTNIIYITNTLSNTVSVIDGSTNAVIDTIAVGNIPGSVAVNPNTNRVYVTNFSSNSVSVIDGSTNTVIETIPVGSSPTVVALNTKTNTAYVAGAIANTVSVIDGSTNDVIDTIPVGTSPFRLTVNPNTNRVYVPNQGSNTVSVIDGSTNTVIDTIPVGSGPIGMTLNPDVPNPVRDPGTDVIDEITNETLQCAYIAELPHLSKFSVGGKVRPTGGSTGGSDGGIFRGRTFAFANPDRTGYDGDAPSFGQVITESGGLKVVAQILDNTGVKDAKLIVGKSTVLMQRHSGAQNWWKGSIPSSMLSGNTVFFKIVARDYNNNIGEYSGSSRVPVGALSNEGASFTIKPSTAGYQPDQAYSITASGIRSNEQNISPQVTIKNTGTEPLQNIRLMLSPEIKGKFLLSDYAIKTIPAQSEYTVLLKLNGRPNIDEMGEPIPYSGKIIISVDNRSPYVLELSGAIPNESASLQSLFMKTLAGKSEQRYKTFEKPDVRISEAEYEVKLGSGENAIINASDELIIRNTGSKPLKNVRIMTSSAGDHFLLDQKNIELVPAGSFVRVKLASNLNNAESRDLQGELLVVPEYGAPVRIPINIGKKLAEDRNSLYEVRTLSGSKEISSTADGIMIRNNSEETIDNVRIMLPRELARSLSLSEDSFRSIEPNSEKIVYMQPRGISDSRVKQMLKDYAGEIIIVSSDGMKKVVPVSIVWKGIASEHFIIYARDNADELAKAAQVINSLERSYYQVTKMIDIASKARTAIYMTSSLDELKMLTNASVRSIFVYDEDVALVWSNSEDVNVLALKEFAHRTMLQTYTTYWTKQKITLDRGNWLIDGVSNYVAGSIVGEHGITKEQLDAFIEQPASFEWYTTSTHSQNGATYTLFKYLVEEYGESIIDKILDGLGSTVVSSNRCDTIEQCALVIAIYDVNGFSMNDKKHDITFTSIVKEWKEYVRDRYNINYLN